VKPFFTPRERISDLKTGASKTPMKNIGRKTMSRITLASRIACLVTLAMAASVFAQTPVMPAAKKKPKPPAYEQTNLVVSGKPLKGKERDKNLLNPWGLVQANSSFWVSDNNAGVSTLYDGNGKIVDIAKKQQFVVTIPPPTSSTATAAPSGLVANTKPTDSPATFSSSPPRMEPSRDGSRRTTSKPCATSTTLRYLRQHSARSTKASQSPRSTDTSSYTRRISVLAMSMSSMPPTTLYRH
jgi:hypothetical protein